MPERIRTLHRFGGDPEQRRLRIQRALRRRHGYALVGYETETVWSDEFPIAIGTESAAQAIWGIGSVHSANAWSVKSGDGAAEVNDAANLALDRLLADIIAQCRRTPGDR